MVAIDGTRKADTALALGAFAALLVIGLTLTVGRPVNDDYWALGALMSHSMADSISWYYTSYQGNVSSWFFILLGQLPWLDGVQPWGSLPLVALTLAILAGACWGALSFLGVRWMSRWRFWAVLLIVTVVAWLSLGSFVSPNGMTLVFYGASTIVHVWPWCFALLALGLALRQKPLTHGWLWLGILGFLAGNLGLVEAVVIGAGTVVVGLLAWRRPLEWPIPRGAGWGWAGGLGLGLAVQLASPATWGRGSGVGSEGALTTNVQAVERLFAQSDALLGPSIRDGLLSVMEVDGWARVLVPVAVVGDLVARPGLLAIFVLAAWWAVRTPGAFALPRSTLKARIVGLLLVIAVGVVAYSASGALYAYAGRHVAGLALAVSAISVGLGVLTRSWWARRQRLLVVCAVVSVAVLVALGVQQVRYGWTRAAAWDAAFATNAVRISEGRLSELVDAPLKAGISQSGLRDHENSGAYVEWVRRQLSSAR